MSISDPRWDDLTEADWATFARTWIAERIGAGPPPLAKPPVLIPDDHETTASAFVTPMNFTASAESQWKFIEHVFRSARDHDEVLGHLAAGPVEHLLSKHGENFIEQIETLARSDDRFACMLQQCDRHMMLADVWARVRAARTGKV